MNAGYESLINLEDLDESKRRIPIVYFYSENDEVYSKEFSLSQVSKLQELNFNVRAVEGKDLQHSFAFNSFEILKQESTLHKAMINGH